ncbi:MAG: lysylphosphatidylglycerol synthase transmembrane domain-containing protein [Chloroflexia bacterium]
MTIESHPTETVLPAHRGGFPGHLRRRWQVYVGLLISAFFLYRVLSQMGTQLGILWTELQGAHYLWIVPGVAVYFLGVWARTWRWHYMLRPVQRVPLHRLFPIVCIGYMGNNIYPARAGELLRAYILRREQGVSISASLATIVAERIFDGIVMLIFVFVGLPFVPAVPPEWRRIVVLFTVLFFGALVAFFLLAVSPERTQKAYLWLIERLIPRRFRRPVQGVADRFLEGLRCLRSPSDLAMIFATSVAVWLAETVKYWFVMHGFAFSVPFFVLMLMNGVVNLMTTLPASPGYIGTFDWPGIEVLVSYLGEKSRAVATAYTFVLHAALWFPITALGAFYMLRRGLSWTTVQREMAARRQGGRAEKEGE